MKFTQALSLSNKFKSLLEPACERIMPVGSVRRGDQNVLQKGCHDIEFLIIQKDEKATDMFGHPLPDDQQLPSPLERVVNSWNNAWQYGKRSRREFLGSCPNHCGGDLCQLVKPGERK